MDASPLLGLGGILDPQYLLDTFGTIGLTIVIFAESCFAFFLPGDSLLFTAGFFSSRGNLDLPILCVCATVAAIAGNQIGYWFGRRFGVQLFERDTRIFRKKHLEKTHEFFEKKGPRSIVLARFIPIVRTFACIIAGAARMDYRKFFIYNVIGAVLWGTGITLAGWIIGKWIGETIDIDKYILPVIAVIILISFIPVFVEYFKHRREVNAVATDVKDVVEKKLD